MDRGSRVIVLFLIYNTVLQTLAINEYFMTCKNEIPTIDGNVTKEGVLTSHNASVSSYPRRHSCQYKIKLAPDQRIVLTKEHFNLYYLSRFDHDFIYIHDKTRHVWYHNVRDFPAISVFPRGSGRHQTETLNIIFETEYNSKLPDRDKPPGFRIHFKIVQDMGSTNGTNVSIHAGYGYMMSSNFPAHDREYSQVKISSDPGQEVNFELLDLSLGECERHGKTTCCSNVLTRFTETNTLMDSACNMTKGDNFTTPGNSVILEYDPVYNGDNVNKTSHFMLKYTVLDCSYKDSPVLPKNSERFSPGKSPELSCKDGYIQRLANGSFSLESIPISCDRFSNTWQNTSSQCYPSANISCGVPAKFPNGTYDYPDNNNNTYGNEVKVKCNTDHHQVAGPASRRCTIHETWSGQKPVCDLIPGKTGRRQGPGDGGNADDKLYLIVGVSTGGALFIIFVILAAVLLLRRRHKKSEGVNHDDKIEEPAPNINTQSNKEPEKYEIPLHGVNGETEQQKL